MTDNTLYNILLIAVFVAAPCTFVSLLYFTAPYGRHADGKKGWGPRIPTKAMWVLMESPSVIAFLIFYFMGENRWGFVPLLLLTMWQTHYIQRTFVYPMKMRVRPGDSQPLSIALMAIVFNIINSYLNATTLSDPTLVREYTVSWLYDPRFIAGVAIFAIGFRINRWADEVLRNLRKPGETGYKIPRGGLYEKITCPNYFGETLEWFGWAIATWSLAGLSFAVFTAANLWPRAIANHKWYLEKFEDYPAERKAVIPYVW